jgi:hypothetical protein
MIEPNKTLGKNKRTKHRTVLRRMSHLGRRFALEECAPVAT